MKKLKFFITYTLLVSLYSNAQELDQTFLNSLPDDIKEDLLNKASTQDNNLQENYSPYKYSSKLEQAEELLKLKEIIERDLEELEKRLSSDEKMQLNYEYKIFGSEFFKTFQTTYMPINEPNPDSSYILDVGDILNIQLIGQQEYIRNFPINGSGSINLPDIGRLIVAGLPLTEASALIKSKINKSFIGTEAFVTLDEIRDINILVTGNAKDPGVYTLSGNSNLLHAINVAGGIGEHGSYREINLLRNNEIIETLDIYDLLINGNYNLKKRLRNGDVVFVQSRKSVVTIAGGVKRPAKYELNKGQYLSDVVNYANGFKRTADIENISLERVLDGRLKTIPILNQKQFSTIKPEDNDLIYVREFPFRQAKITGAVKKPGSYIIAAGETLNDLIGKAGGLNSNAYPFGAIYTNQDAELINKKSKEVLYQEFLDNIINISQKSIGQNFDLTPIVSLTQEIKDAKPNGRIVVDIVNETQSNLFTIKEGDELYIPEITNNVYVYGEIASEGAIMFSPNKDVEYFVEKSGGFKKFADTQAIYILHPNGESSSYSKNRNIFENSPKSDIEIYPGSIIFVPRKLDDSTSRRLATQAYVSILGNLGIALASLSTINNQ